MSGVALPVIPLGNKTINLVTLCYWEIMGDTGLIEIIYPGPTRCCLTLEETQMFLQFLNKASAPRSSLITPAQTPISLY